MDAMEAWALSLFGHGCSRVEWMRFEVIIVRECMHLVLDALVSSFGHGCALVPWTLSGMDTPGSGRTGGIDVIIVRALMLLVLEAPVE